MDSLPEPVRTAGWPCAAGRLRAHQAELLATCSGNGRSALLIAPTGGGKTLAGFLPSADRTHERRGPGPRLRKGRGLHTLYISPLKALAVDIRRNLEVPIAEMQLPVRAETRTGDTPQSRRLRQRERPPHLLMTTPESLALLLSYPDAARSSPASLRDRRRAACLRRQQARRSCWRFASRGSATLAPQARVGLSATVADPPALRAGSAPRAQPVEIVMGEPGAPPAVSIIVAQERASPGAATWAHAVPEVYMRIIRRTSAIVFVNTRAQAETCLPGAVADQRRQPADRPASRLARRRAAAQGRGGDGGGQAARRGRTSSLDLGIDWGDVDLVIQMGAPKGAAA
jgi:ATP-dependent Lhr-like helicase